MNLPSSLQIALSFLIACSVKATLLLALAAVAAYVLRQRSAAVRHQAWALGIATSLLLPVLTLLLPGWHSATIGNAVKLWAPAPKSHQTRRSVTHLLVMSLHRELFRPEGRR